MSICSSTCKHNKFCTSVRLDIKNKNDNKELSNNLYLYAQRIFDLNDHGRGIVELFFKPDGFDKVECFFNHCSPLERWMITKQQFVLLNELVSVGLCNSQEMSLLRLDHFRKIEILINIDIDIFGFLCREMIGLNEKLKNTRYKVCFEITERGFEIDVDRTKEIIRKLNSQGLNFAIDDFSISHDFRTELVDKYAECFKYIKVISPSAPYTKEFLTQVKMCSKLRENSEIIFEHISSLTILGSISMLGNFMYQGYALSEPIKLNV